MTPLDVLYANHRFHESYSGSSLIGSIADYQLWSVDAYWQIDRALYELAPQTESDEQLFRDAVREATFIYSHLLLSFGWHFDPYDDFEYENLTRDEIYDWRDRVNATFEGFLTGGMPDNTACKLRNPSIQ